MFAISDPKVTFFMEVKLVMPVLMHIVTVPYRRTHDSPLAQKSKSTYYKMNLVMDRKKYSIPRQKA